MRGYFSVKLMLAMLLPVSAEGFFPSKLFSDTAASIKISDSDGVAILGHREPRQEKARGEAECCGFWVDCCFAEMS